MKAAHSLFLAVALVACSGGDGKDDTTDTTDTTDVADTTDTTTETGTSDTWWTDTGGVCTGSGLCLCPDNTCGAEAGKGDCDRDFDGCICAVANDMFGDCTTTGGSGHSGGSGGTKTGTKTGTTTTGTTSTGTTSTGSTGSGTTTSSTASKGGVRSLLDLFGY